MMPCFLHYKKMPPKLKTDGCGAKVRDRGLWKKKFKKRMGFCIFGTASGGGKPLNYWWVFDPSEEGCAESVSGKWPGGCVIFTELPEVTRFFNREES